MHFNRESRCILYGSHIGIVQNMLDYDFLCNRSPSVAAIFSSQKSGQRHKVFYGQKEIFIPSISSWDEVDQFPGVDTLINLASFRSATAVNKAAILSEKFQHIFTIAEGIAERETRELIALAKWYKTTMFGPAIVWGLISGVFRISHTGGSLENIVKSKLYRAGNVAIVSKSGGMMNELCRVVSKQSNGVHTALQVWWDRFPMTRFEDVLRYYASVEDIRMIVMLGEVGNRNEIAIADMVKKGELTKPIVAWCIGEAAEGMKTEVQFGHAGAKANSEEEKASYKNKMMRESGIYVPDDYDGFGKLIGKVFEGLDIDPSYDEMSEEETIKAKVMVINNRRKTRFSSRISDERGEELLYHGIPVSDFVKQGSLARVIGQLWLQKELPDYALHFLDSVLILLADHGPAVSGATNAIVTARAGKDVVSSLIAGLSTIGPRFGGAIDGAAQNRFRARKEWLSATEFVSQMKKSGKLILWIGHKVKSKYNPDKRCELLEEISQHFPERKHLMFAKAVEELTLAKKPNLILNVDGYVAAMLLDIFVSMWMSDEDIQSHLDAGIFNALFILARSIGFIGHILDQKRLKEWLYRTPWEDIWYMGDEG